MVPHLQLVNSPSPCIERVFVRSSGVRGIFLFRVLSCEWILRGEGCITPWNPLTFPFGSQENVGQAFQLPSGLVECPQRVLIGHVPQGIHSMHPIEAQWETPKEIASLAWARRLVQPLKGVLKRDLATLREFLRRVRKEKQR